MDDMEMLAMMFDVLLIVAVLGLWMAWIKQNKQQGRIEDKLAQAASELQEATEMLDQALDQISQLKTPPSTKDDLSNTPKATSKIAPVTAKKHEPDVPSSADDNAQVAQILRMQREGESPEGIAQQLEIPLARVKLLLMLSSPDSSK